MPFLRPLLPLLLLLGAASPALAAAPSCNASLAWITNPSYPREVADEKSFCVFEQFAWQAFLDLVQPSADGSGVLQFETWMPYYGIFVGKGQQPTPYGKHPPDPCNAPPTPQMKTGAQPFIYSGITKQAGSLHALRDPSGQLAWYGLRVNDSAYEMLTTCELYRSNCAGPLRHAEGGINVATKYPTLAFPNGAVELKTAWKVLTQEEVSSKLFYTVQGWINATQKSSCQQLDLGLVGIHIVTKTEDFPAFIWASFEHRNNAPNCQTLKAKPPLGGSWSFFDSASDAPTNTYLPGKPTQVCRMHPQGDSTTGIFPNGQSCQLAPQQFACREPTKTLLAESTTAIVDINQSAQALIRANPKRIDPVWANYELVGNVWTTDRVLSPPQLQAQQGSLSAANTTMETYVQNGEAGVTPTNNCFSCHNQSNAFGQQLLPPAGLSHIFVKVQPESGGCQAGTLPAACVQTYTTSGKPAGQTASTGSASH